MFIYDIYFNYNVHSICFITLADSFLYCLFIANLFHKIVPVYFLMYFNPSQNFTSNAAPATAAPMASFEGGQFDKGKNLYCKERKKLFNINYP